MLLFITKLKLNNNKERVKQPQNNFLPKLAIIVVWITFLFTFENSCCQRDCVSIIHYIHTCTYIQDNIVRAKGPLRRELVSNTWKNFLLLTNMYVVKIISRIGDPLQLMSIRMALCLYICHKVRIFELIYWF